MDCGRWSARSARPSGSVCSRSSTWTIRSELWWQFEAQAEVSRFLRASVGASVVLLLFGFARLIGYAPHEAPRRRTPTLTMPGRRSRRRRRRTRSWCISETRRCCSTTIERRSSCTAFRAAPGWRWAIPSGPDERLSDLLRRFLERCDDFGGVPVFYEVGKTHLHRYADFGLTFVKLGEEAKVDLTTFTLEGSQSAKHRQAVRRLEKDGGSFRVVDTTGVPAIMDQLRAVSDDWLAAKATAEKGFSLGFFDEAYVSRFPVAVIEVGGRVQAFANIWAGPQTSGAVDRPHAVSPRRAEERAWRRCSCT